MSTDAVRERDEALRERVRDLPDQARRQYYREYEKRVRDPDTYAVLNWFFLAGLHHFYLGRVVRGAADLLAMLLGVLLLLIVPPVGVALILLVMLIELPALFRSQVIVLDYNVQLGEALCRQLQGGGLRR